MACTPSPATLRQVSKGLPLTAHAGNCMRRGCKYKYNLLSFSTVCRVLVIPGDEGRQAVLCEEPRQVAAEHGGGAPQSSKVSP